MSLARRPTLDPETVRFDGETYEPVHDKARLTGQVGRVFDATDDGEWRTLAEISAITGDPEASISARLRDLRKERFGGFVVERQHRGEPRFGLYEYRVLPPAPKMPTTQAPLPWD